MRILFILTLTTIARHFEEVILALADRGHSVAIASPARRTNWLPDAIVNHSRVSQLTCPERRGDDWKKAANHFRLLVDYARYLDGPFVEADKLRERALKTLVIGLTDGHQRHFVAKCRTCRAKIRDADAARMLVGGQDPGRKNFRNLLRLVENVIPSDPARERFLTEQAPDIVLISPLVGLGSEQADWVKSARKLGIPTGFPVFSWDNLTTKGIIHVPPDQMYVWNDTQRQEAIEYHGMAADCIHVTGAPRFDAFFAMKPSTDRDSFCHELGFNPAAPILAYLCSSDFVAGGEVEFLSHWIDEIRREPSLALCNILIRPHPRGVRQWSEFDATRWPHVAISISRALNADPLLYDTLHHSAAVVGLNTSAEIEAAILGKPVCTILVPDLERGQQGTLHFRYLLEEDGGFVQVARDFDEHRRHLAGAVAGRFDAERISAFVERFVRPRGLGNPATPILADAIEQSGRPSPVAAVKRWLKMGSA